MKYEVYKPLLLITNKKDINMLTSNLWEIVDDIIVTPILKAELFARIEVLLRTHRYSKQIVDLKNKDLKNIINSLLLLQEEKEVLSQNIPLAIYSINNKGLVLSWNLFAEKMYGWSKDEVIGKFLPILLKGDKKNFLNVINTLSENKSNFRIEAKRVKKDGTIIDCLCFISLVKGKNEDTNIIVVVEDDITEKIANETLIKKNLKEKELLLSELYHRTKNNMYLIYSMLNIKANIYKNEEIYSFVEEIGAKIQSIALVHQKLYHSSDLSSISLKNYLIELIELLKDNYKVRDRNIVVKMIVDEINILFDIAIPLGLIISELFSNTIKHAFPDNRDGIINIKLYHDKNRRSIKLLFSDNGVGIKKDFNFSNIFNSGLNILVGIVEGQLKGKIKFKNKNGFNCYVNIPETVYTKRI